MAIYNRYVSQNQIYSSDSMASDIPILVDRDEYSEMDVYMKVNENLIIDMSLNIEGINRSSIAVNTALENYRAALNNSNDILKANSKDNKDEYVYFISRITVTEDRAQNKLIFKEDTYRYTAYSKTRFDVYITSPILAETRDLFTSSSKTKFDLKDTNIDIEKLDNVVEYNLTTGNLYGEDITPEANNDNNNVNQENQINNNTNVPTENNLNTNESINNSNNSNSVNNEGNSGNDSNSGNEENRQEDSGENDNEDDESTVVTV